MNALSAFAGSARPGPLIACVASPISKSSMAKFTFCGMSPAFYFLIPEKNPTLRIGSDEVAILVGERTV